MIDPSDRLLETYREGDADITPGAPDAGPWGEIPDPQPLDQPRRPDMFIPYYFAALAGLAGPQTIDAGLKPDYWIVTVDETANGIINFWPYEGQYGPRSFVSGASVRSFTIPGVTQYLTLLSVGAGNPNVMVQAVAGHLCIVGPR